MLNKLLKLDLIYLVALTVFGTIFYGLIINTLLPALGIQSPLSFPWISPVYLLCVLPLYKLIYEVKAWLFDSKIQLGYIILIVLNPLVAVMGANYVNNSGGGGIAIFSILTTCLTLALLLSRSVSDSHSNDRTHKAFIYSASLSLIYAFALRSKYLSGYDIHQEFRVFLLTIEHNIWSMDTLRDAYNACLSITILPTIIRNLSGLSELVVFRYFYPLLLAFIPVGVYLLGTRFLNSKYSLAGSMLFMIQAQYYTQLPALLRQGIAFLFFTLLVDSLIRRDISKKYVHLSMVVFGTGIVLSHYSTTYITLAVLLITKATITMTEIFILKRREVTALNIWIIGYLVGIAFLWNVIITDTAGGLLSTLKIVANNIDSIFSLENRSETVKGLFYQQSDNNKDVNQYIAKASEMVSDPEKYRGYEISPVSVINGVLPKWYNPVVLYFHLLLPWVLRIMIVVGFVLIVKNSQLYFESLMVGSLSLTMLSIIALAIILPMFSINYNFERLFLQTLILLAPLSMISIRHISRVFSSFFTILFVIVFLISYIMKTSGLVDRSFFNIKSWIFDNEGETYLRYYTSQDEFQSLQWLRDNSKPNALLYADRYSRLRIIAYAEGSYSRVSSEINPVIVQNEAYVFSGLAATLPKIVFAEVNNTPLRFTFPTKYMENFKNTIYSNSKTRIYK